MGLEHEDRLTRRRLLAAAGSVAAAAALARPAAGSRPRAHPGADEFDSDTATAWFDLALALVRDTPGYTPPVASRTFGYAGLTLYEALVPGLEGFRSLAGRLADLPPLPAAGRNAAYDWPTVANAALAAVLRELFPTAPAARLAALEALEDSFATRFRTSLAPGVFVRSERRGRDVAAAVVDWARVDGGHAGWLRNFPPYTPPAGPGLWVPTPPGFQPALQPFWGRNRCFVLPLGAAAPPGDHPAYSENAASSFYAEALEVLTTTAGLTPEQLAVARFWSDDPGATATPPGHSIAIATQVLRLEGASLAAAAETYAKVGIAVADAFVACWHEKYRYNLLRPVTYLRRLFDPAWLPVLVTPPFPEYPSGHSVQSAAVAQVLTDLFGEAYAFVDRTHEARGLGPRSFRSFSEAAEEAAISRLYGGIHFRAAIVNGLAQGTRIGRAVSALPFRG